MSIKNQMDWVKREAPEVRIAQGEAPVDKEIEDRSGQMKTVKAYTRPIREAEALDLEAHIKGLLRAELQADPLQLGYAKARDAEALAFLLNTPGETVEMVPTPIVVEGQETLVNRPQRKFRPARIAEIFNRVPFAPNAVTAEDVQEALDGK